MHNVQNVCGCIGNLMKTLIGAAFGAQQHHGARETMGPCNASIQDGSNAPDCTCIGVGCALYLQSI